MTSLEGWAMQKTEKTDSVEARLATNLKWPHNYQQTASCTWFSWAYVVNQIIYPVDLKL